MTKREQLKQNVIQLLKEEIAKVENFDDQEFVKYFGRHIRNCGPCVFGSRPCGEFCEVRLYNYLTTYGNEEVNKDENK